MPEVLEAETITSEQREWANAILRLAGGATDKDSEGETEKKKDRYGKGLQDSILKDGRTLPQAYTNALVKGAPMISADDWSSAMKSRKITPADLEKLLKDRDVIAKNLKELPEKKKEMSKQIGIYNALSKSIGANKRCDLSSYGMGVVTRTNSRAEKDKADKKSDELEEEIKKIKQQTDWSLALLDAPENNPEHLEIGKGLKDLGQLEKKFAAGELDEKQYIKDKAELLYGLQAMVFQWNDRRTREHLPPSADAVAMADMVQRVHLEMTKSVIEKGLPMPLSMENEVLLSEQEKAEIQATWKNLVESGAKGSQEGSRVVVGVPPNGKFIKNSAEGEQFRIETLANLSRLMQSPAGRGLIGEINKSKHMVDFASDDSAACARDSIKKSKDRKQGCGSTVDMVLGAKDSDVSLSTETGATLFAARFIALGHEMVHALHNAQGKNRRDVPLTKNDIWNNSEEYQTIFKGKLSEQTLRQQYGLSAERFGHKVPPVLDTVFNAVDDMIQTANEMSKRNPAIVDELLKKRGFDPTNIPDKLKLALTDSDLKGPIPLGWQMSQLTFEQVKEILRDPALYAHLSEFSWPPYGLDRKRIEEIYENKEHHPRSERGIRMRALGGLDALKVFSDFEAKTAVKLEAPKGTTWEDKLAALEGAHSVLVDLSVHHDAPEVRTAAKGAAKLQKRIAKVTKAFEGLEKRFTGRGGDAALDEIAGYNEQVANKKLPVDRTNLVTKVHTLDEAAKWLAIDLQKVPSELQSSLSTGTTGARLKATAALWKKTKEEIEQLGGFATRAAAQGYNRTLGRALELPKESDLFSVLETLQLVKADLVQLKSETKSEPLKSALTGANLPADLSAALKAFKEMQLVFASYGGPAGHGAIPAIAKLAGVALEAKEAELSGQIAECKAAADAFLKHATEGGDPETLSIVKSKGTLSGKIALVEKAQQRKTATANLASSQEKKSQEMEEQGTAMSIPFESSKVDTAEQGVKASSSAIKAVTDVYREVSDALASLPGSIPALIPALDELEKQANDYLEGHKNPWTDIGQKRQTLCEDLLKTVADTRNLYNGVQAKAREAIVEVTELAKDPDSLSLSAVNGLAVIANNPYLSLEVQSELTKAISDLASLIDEATLKRESELA